MALRAVGLRWGLQKEKSRFMDKALKVTELEKHMSLISYITTFIGVAAVCPAMVAGALPMFLSAYIARDYKIYYMCRKIFWLLAVMVVFLGVCALFVQKFRRNFRNPLRVYPKAAEYYRQCAFVSPLKRRISAALLGIGIICAIAVPFVVKTARYYSLDILLAAEVMTIGCGAFFSVFYWMKQKIFGRIIIIPVEDGSGEEEYDERRERRIAVIKLAAYWVFAVGVYLSISIIFQGFTLYAFILVFAFVYFMLSMMINNPLRRFSSIRSKRFSMRILSIFPVAATVGLYFFIVANGLDYNSGYIAELDYGCFTHNSSFVYDRETGVYTISSTNEEFRILQLTDIHLCGSITTIGTDHKALDACYELIREAQPDLIIITGDMVYPIPIQTLNGDNLDTFYQLCTFMNNIGIPWAMVYGNHDTETVAEYNAKELSGIFRYFREQPGSPMLYAEKQPEIYGRYNQYLRIENADGSLNHLVFLVDSNDYLKDVRKTNEYDSVHPDQMQWYAETIDQVSAEEGRVVPSFVFMHIPFPAFAEAQKALEYGRADAVYLFGENGEGVSCPKEDSGFFDLILEKGSTEAVFVGHDHLNNMGIRYKGVDLVYSKSIDYFAYPGIAKKTDQRGGTLIVLSPDGSYRIEQVSYTKDSFHLQ